LDDRAGCDLLVMDVQTHHTLVDRLKFHDYLLYLTGSGGGGTPNPETFQGRSPGVSLIFALYGSSCGFDSVRKDHVNERGKTTKIDNDLFPPPAALSIFHLCGVAQGRP
ncbi:hypothetical protein, partial [Desulfacinum infernum]|uniref:hypothetical protein n=1 Tax=Desulfacinum infernum TaxID=35837 RepID=UPI001C4A317B